MTDWAFEHPILATLIALAVIEAIAAPFRWQRRRGRPAESAPPDDAPQRAATLAVGQPAYHPDLDEVMTVGEVTDDGAWCTWTDRKGERVRALFAVHDLKPIGNS